MERSQPNSFLASMRARVRIQLRFDEMLPNFAYLSPLNRNPFPLSQGQPKADPCSNPIKSGNSTSKDSNFTVIYRKNKSKSEQTINDSYR